MCIQNPIDATFQILSCGLRWSKNQFSQFRQNMTHLEGKFTRINKYIINLCSKCIFLQDNHQQTMMLVWSLEAEVWILCGLKWWTQVESLTFKNFELLLLSRWASGLHISPVLDYFLLIRCCNVNIPRKMSSVLFKYQGIMSSSHHNTWRQLIFASMWYMLE